MKTTNTRRGFTLIELLVVVLIIGILAAVAVPQYQKAIWKSRLAQWDVMFDAGRKAIEAYLLENGWPEEGSEKVLLTGKNGVGTVEMPGNCDIDDIWCYTSAGRVFVRCETSYCIVRVYCAYNVDGTFGNKALGDDSPVADYNRLKAGDSYFGRVQGKAGCLWASTHPDIPVKSASITSCKNTYGVTLPNPEYVEE